MNRVALDFGFIKIYWYSITMFLGVLLGIIVAYIEIKRKKIDITKFENLAFFAILSGFVGARLYYVLFNLDYYLAYPIEIVEVWNGGLAIHGAIIGSVLAIFIYCKKNKLNFIEILDICSPAILIGQIIGRWGNFFNGEAYGRIVSLSFLKNLHLPDFIIKGMYINGKYREPTFLYESILSFIGFIILLIIRRNKNIKIGMLTSIYLIWYGIERLIIESFRSDSLMLMNIKVAQLVSIIFIISGIIIFIYSYKNNKLYNKIKK